VTSAVVLTSDSETGIEEEESSEPDSFEVLCGVQLIIKQWAFSSNHGSEYTVIIDNPESVVEVVNSVIGDYVIQLFTEQS
jgi:hypothetical protein